MFRVLCVGGGHVGLPLSLRFWQAGNDVTVLDIDPGKMEAVRRGVMPFMEQGCDQVLADASRSDRFRAMTYADSDLDGEIAAADHVVMTLGTPLGTDYTFRFDQYFHVLDRLVPHLANGVTLVVRSTVAPHFTRNVISARVAAARDCVPGRDFYVAFCPERLVQGRALADIDDLPEIIGADDPETASRAEALFLTLGRDKVIHHVSTVEAELSKLFLNTFRYTLFGLANEFAQIYEQYGADLYAILEAANGGYPRGGIPRPGPSRGPCLGKDTATLAFASTTGLIPHAAIKTNENLVIRVARDLSASLGSLVNRRISVLGRAFKADTDDVRDNLTDPLINLLDREGAVTAVYDPFVRGCDDVRVLQGSDAVVLMSAHAVIAGWTQDDVLRLTARRRDDLFVYDLWNVWPWADRILGRGSDNREDSGNGRVGLADARGRAAPA